MKAILSGEKYENIVYTYKRNYKKLRIVWLLFACFAMSFFVIKFFSERGEIKLDMKVTDYINREMDRILQFKTREKQNEEFKRLRPRLPIEPVRMTLTTAVFKYTSINPNVILKRVIHNPSSNLNEDYMSMSLSSPYICKTLKTFRTKRTLPDGSEQVLLWIFSEFLDVKISQRSVGGDEEKIRVIIRDALRGLEHLHSLNVAHLDLKIGNIMGKTVESGVVYKLIDFGYSQLMPSTGSVSIPKKNYGTYPYKPPEVVFKNEHGLKSDIWSLGAICWFLSLQYTPFYFDGFEKDLSSYRRFLKKRTDRIEDRNNHRFIFSRNTGESLKDFVKQCMQVEPEDRPTATQLLQHPFITREKAVFNGDSQDDVEDLSYDDYASSESTVR